LTSAREARSKTPTSPDPVKLTIARLPSGVNFTRIGNSPAWIVAATLSVAASTTEIVFASRLATHTSRPSGVTATPSAPLPVATSPVTLPAPRSTALNVPAAIDVTHARLPSGDAATMCETSLPVGIRFVTFPVFASTTASSFDPSDVTSRPPSGSPASPCGRERSPMSTVESVFPVPASISRTCRPGLPLFP
jgi:hypothetical protein